ncbi:MAG: LAGLIDADG family homing endonuclease [Lewinella sp.]
MTGDTLVHDAVTGKRVRIDALENRVGNFLCQGVDDNNRQTTGWLTHWVCNGVKPVFEVKLRSGKSVKMTGNHRVLTENGWKELRELSQGDFIGTPRSLLSETDNDVRSYDQDQLRVLAYLLADGSLSGVGPTADFVNKSESLIKAYTESIETFDRLQINTLTQARGVTRVMVGGTDKTSYHEPNTLVQYLRDLKLKTTTGGCRSHEKFVPEFIFGLSLNEIAFFLACYWDCDGFIGERFTHIKTISPDLSAGIQSLLLRLGIHSTIHESQYYSERRKETTTAFQVTVYNLDKFHELITPLCLIKKIGSANFRGRISSDSVSRGQLKDEIDACWKGSARSFMAEYGFDRQHLTSTRLKNRPRISSHVAKELTTKVSLPRTERNLRVRWDEIIAITPVGRQKVYDISVEGIHNFVGNNVILHNCVYQEQIMLLSQSLAGFSKGEADVLRKAMGKKKKEVLDKMYPKFVEGATAKGHPEDKLGKIWKDWEAFASYAFNKSHSTCYALVAYHTAYLKAHYPAEYMASVLTHNKSDQTKMSFFLRECKRMDVPVLQPDINESQAEFSVNKQGAIRIGMTALKGVGEGPVEAILDARKEGDFESLFDMLLRIEPGSVNKRVLEALTDAGGFDCFEDMHRAQYYAPTDKFDSYLEDAVKTANGTLARQAEAASSLFAEAQDEIKVDPPKPPDAKPFLLPVKLAREKEVTGIYVSGHPLDGYKLEIDNYVTCGLADLDPRKYGRSTVKLAGMIVGARHLISKNGNGWGIFELGDYDETIEFKLFGDDYLKFKHVLIQGTALFLTATFQKKWQSDDLELKISEIKLLEGVGEELTSAIILKMTLAELTSAKVVALDDLCQRFQGDAKLRMVFYDREEDSKLKMFSLKRTVQADTDFVKEIEKMGIKYRLEGA